MNTLRIDDAPTHTDIDWTPFPGGELEGARPKAQCPACRARIGRDAVGAAGAGKPALCFQCYRADIEKNRKLKAAAELDTASDARFQCTLPFEAVNTSRLARLKVEREEARTKARAGAGSYIEKRHRAQIDARHALARLLHGLKQRELGAVGQMQRRQAAADMAMRAAEMQLPESWLPFVVAQ
ncbi:MAG: hypothetical protein ABL982_12145 [Vicinamibacterales bacterium]